LYCPIPKKEGKIRKFVLTKLIVPLGVTPGAGRSFKVSNETYVTK
jgi:hypothetical protein